MQKIRLPIALEPYRERFEQHIKPVVRLTLSPSLDTNYWDSKIAGYPYLPIGTDFPKDSEGNYMFLMAQINFAQMPHLQDYPTKGILQFHISNSKDIPLGLDFSKMEEMGNIYQPNPQKYWRVLYFPEINTVNCQTDFSFLGNDRQYTANTPVYIPIQKEWTEKTGICLKLSFEKTQEPPLYGDYQFEPLLHTDNPDDFDFWDRFGDSNASFEVMKQYNELHSPYGHKIGGYAGFSQEDPRIHYPEWKDGVKVDYPLPSDNRWLSLLQLESDDYLQWGDCGVGHLFIRQKDLENLDFSKVWYYWDCC
jgi:uncharacterized protein YwqG